MRHPPMTRYRPTFNNDRPTSTSLTLLERVKVHDGEAWHRLVALYTPLLRYWCHRWGVAGEDANDVLQEVFQAVFCGLKDFRREGDSFRGWLRGIARNKALILFRRRGSTRSLGELDSHRRSLLIPDRVSEPASSEEGELVGALYQDALNLVRDEFEGRTWIAFWRATVDGQASTDIAEDLGMSAAAVRQAKSRILRRLKDVLGETVKP